MNLVNKEDDLVEIYKRNSFIIPYKDTTISFSITNLLSPIVYKIPFAIITAENPMNNECIGKEGDHSEKRYSY